MLQRYKNSAQEMLTCPRSQKIKIKKIVQNTESVLLLIVPIFSEHCWQIYGWSAKRMVVRKRPIVQEDPSQKPGPKSDLGGVGTLYESACVVAVQDRLHESNKHTSIILILKYLVIIFL